MSRAPYRRITTPHEEIEAFAVEALAAHRALERRAPKGQIVLQQTFRDTDEEGEPLDIAVAALVGEEGGALHRQVNRGVTAGDIVLGGRSTSVAPAVRSILVLLWHQLSHKDQVVVLREVSAVIAHEWVHARDTSPAPRPYPRADTPAYWREPREVRAYVENWHYALLAAAPELRRFRGAGAKAYRWATGNLDDLSVQVLRANRGNDAVTRLYFEELACVMGALGL